MLVITEKEWEREEKKIKFRQPYILHTIKINVVHHGDIVILPS